MARLFLVRHGETALNSSERYWGQTDVALSDLGITQAERLRDYLAGERISAAYASNLKRALDTAEIIAAAHSLKVIACPELREINFGEIEGLTYAEASERFPDLAAKWRGERNTDIEFPGGESFHELKERVGTFPRRLENHTEGEAVLVVAHAGVLRTLICCLVGLELKNIYQLRIDLASLSVVDTYPGGGTLSWLNDISHLA